ncbi:MAG: hypothetical protein IKV42_01430, partial [Burkholderiaceae bacterium]|nr:hypothetical protein [Burkholderiaceae bacterium]
MTVLHAERLLPGVADWMDELVAIRHDLHQNPELGFETERTVGKICEHLRALTSIFASGTSSFNLLYASSIVLTR